jgi:putative transposase
MREMGIHGFCPGSNLSKRLHKKYLYPYLLRGLNINRPNQVWSVDITYCRMKRGFMYMAAIIDWHSRYIVGYSFSNTLEKTFVINAIKKAITRYGKPDKWEKLYLEDYETGHQLRDITKEYVEHYNNKRPHQSLRYKTPAEYYNSCVQLLSAV